MLESSVSTDWIFLSCRPASARALMVHSSPVPSRTRTASAAISVRPAINHPRCGWTSGAASSRGSARSDGGSVAPSMGLVLGPDPAPMPSSARSRGSSLTRPPYPSTVSNTHLPGVSPLGVAVTHVTGPTEFGCAAQPREAGPVMATLRWTSSAGPEATAVPGPPADRIPRVRIALVSAHYPPNFVSGGTLVPQRIADGFARRGHQVSVFAGSIDDGQPDLTVRREVTGSGVAIQWTSVTGMLGWSDTVNYANDDVDAEFSRWLSRTRPDVVHFHTLQGFGGSLLSTAAASGAAVVVTMHDMWWWCARQFLSLIHISEPTRRTPIS